MPSSDLQTLVDIYGIETQYTDAWGKPASVSEQSQRKLLSALNVDADALTTEQLIDDKNRQFFHSILPPVGVFRHSDPLLVKVNVPIEHANDEALITITTEKGDVFSFRASPIEGEMTDAYIDEIGEIQQYQLCLLEQIRSTLPLGYHRLDVVLAKQSASMKLIVAPQQSYIPSYLEAGGKSWGFSVQLYCLRSKNNWGVGDFGDLSKLVSYAAQMGADFIGLNPIHALFPANPDACSPYGPSSRIWVNFLYLDVAEMPCFDSAAVQEKIADSRFQAKLHAARETEWVDYALVTDLKISVLELIFHQYASQYLSKNTKQNKAFKAFIDEGGKSLHVHATFDLIQQHLNQRGAECFGWQDFPEEFSDPDNVEVAKLIKQNKKQFQFFLFLQWQAQIQLNEVQQTAINAGMKIGLYRDLAVGVSNGSAEIWGNPNLYCSTASIGAPPDVLGPLGQNWGLPPMQPEQLYQQAYQPIIDLFAKNMSASGALRIDHVMGLLRLWWVPQGEDAKNGGYVYYPVDDLLAILALESHRNESLVIGEDLGTVPPEIRDKLAQNGIFSYRVFFFEQAPDGGFFSPEHYPVQSMATLTTHDMPTLIGFWHCLDLETGRELGVYPDEGVLQSLYHERHRNKQAILDSLHGHQILASNVGTDVNSTGMSEPLNHGMHIHMARGSSALLTFQLEDWIQMEKPVNIPGTFNEYPNWKRKLTCDLEDIFNQNMLQSLAKQISEARQIASVRGR